MITADRDPAGTVAKSLRPLREKKNAPAMTGEKEATAAAARLAAGSRTNESAKI